MAELEDLPAGKVLIGERDYERALAHIVASAEKTLMIFDPDLSRGAFKSQQIADILQTFLAKARYAKLTIIVHDSKFLNEYCVRLLKLLHVFGHQMEIRVSDERAHIAQDAMVIADAKHTIHRFHIQQARFKYVMDDSVMARPLIERYEELLEASPTIISASTLGL